MLGFFPRVFKRYRVSHCWSLVFKNCGMLEYPGSQRAFLPQPQKHVCGQTPRRLYVQAPAPANAPHYCSTTLTLISYLCSAGRGVLSEPRASPAGCRRYQCYQIPLLAPTPKKTAAPRPV